MKTYILQLADSQANLDAVGGKGMSLAKLANAGLPVPDGFHITTEAYRRFVEENNLQPGIKAALMGIDASRTATLETASQSIRQLFATGTIPGDAANAIVSAYAVLPGTNPPVAIRSSATAEDLPEASFAGQQDTFLNISGADQVLDATRKCWASLWTGRAIGYRLKHKIAAEEVALAVVVQNMVNAEAAGVLFTTNPLNYERDEVVINAAWGLGESIVAGAVTPDILTVRKSDGKVIHRETAQKTVMTVRTDTGTEEKPVPDSLVNKPVLSDANASELVRISTQIENLYNMPMDIEWALADGKFAILQARAITTLGEVPLEWKPPSSNGVYMRASIVDLMPDPLSPLFATLGLTSYTAQMYPLARELTRSNPVLPEGYFTTINYYAYMNAKFPTRGYIWFLFGLLPSYPRLARTLVKFWRDEAYPQYQEAVARSEAKDTAGMSGVDLWQEIQSVMDSAATYTNALMFATMGVSAGSEALLTQLYKKFAQRADDTPAATLLMGWNNLPCQAEKSLFDLAQFSLENDSLRLYLVNTPTDELVQQYEGGQAPPRVETDAWQAFCRRFEMHLETFGHMVFELDFTKPLPKDYPAPMLEAIKMYLRGEGINPYIRQKEGERKRIEITEETLKRLKGFRLWLFRKVLYWAQSFAEIREDALAEIGLGYPILRKMLLALGEKFVDAGAMHTAGDIFWLEKEEIDAAVINLEKGLPLESKQVLIEQRQAFWQKTKQSTPPPMLPPRKKYMGINTKVWLAESEANQAGDTLIGVATSPGRVTAQACVLHGPEDFDQMRPGDVLVAGTTTPAWTPLFAMASAVVTDIGGPLSHGSIVAREYGIPAVMGTGVATRRIQDGQTVVVDGGAGTVSLLHETR